MKKVKDSQILLKVLAWIPLLALYGWGCFTAVGVWKLRSMSVPSDMIPYFEIKVLVASLVLLPWAYAAVGLLLLTIGRFQRLIEWTFGIEILDDPF